MKYLEEIQIELDTLNNYIDALEQEQEALSEENKVLRGVITLLTSCRDKKLAHLENEILKGEEKNE